ncbi:hypothetical protein XAC3810_770128 [Xanthomonas citri pv. citri]|nr:hypothetical protein XAC3810_770128 [Xanthomonas citri pv. citri]CEJ48451.1 hypothetical protein XAB3213_4180015 [Xanthomonas citri pv. bilvae]CEE49357.1 hypothetical protein XAC2911_830126 [Xanthomonas citri pv. citri]CEE53612.1 hypothetical protein XACS584_1250127 [Xanthomonas citri pv. citri]CEE82377.1 hypothetical protein XAC2852_820131 [Xanthomonas citri pv. citri]
MPCKRRTLATRSGRVSVVHGDLRFYTLRTRTVLTRQVLLADVKRGWCRHRRAQYTSRR